MVTALLVTSAATLFESAPFILAAVALAQLRRNARIDAYLGCGCGVGPSARSLPAAAATYLLFGPVVAGARLAAAMLVARLQRAHRSCAGHRISLLHELALITPVAITGAGAALLLPALGAWRAPSIPSFLSGAAGAFVMAPCALGAAAFAASMHSAAPAAAAGFLCVAGIVDLRAWVRRSETRYTHDAFAYAIFSLACAIVAARRGGDLVHPKLAAALWPCALAALYMAFRFRAQTCARLRAAPCIMLCGALLAAPLPQYHATETTLDGAFAGEQVDFTGVLTHTGQVATLVRYAITCCRADAAPVVVRLLDAPPATMHGWVHAHGTLVARGADLRLLTSSLAAVDPPADPFVYR